MSRIGEKVKAAREAKKIPAKKLAKSCGVSESYIYDVESGRRVLNDTMINALSKVLDVNLNEPLFSDENMFDEPKEDEKPLKQAEPSAEWQSAFSSIIKDIPVYDGSMNNVTAHKSLPVVDKKVEGYNPEKLIYITAADDSMSGFRIKSNDLVMTFLTHEFTGSGIYFIEYGGSRAIRNVRRLDSSKLLIVSNLNGIKTETLSDHDVIILGRCIKAEIDLNMQ